MQQKTVETVYLAVSSVDGGTSLILWWAEFCCFVLVLLRIQICFVAVEWNCLGSHKKNDLIIRKSVNGIVGRVDASYFGLFGKS